MNELETCAEENLYFSNKKWLSDFRAQQLKVFTQQGFPTRKDELWKYTEIKENAIPKQKGEIRELTSVEQSDVSPIRFVFINGHFSEKLSCTTALPNDVILLSLDKAFDTMEERIKPYLLREYDVKKFPFATLNSAMMTNGLFLEIPQRVKLENPVHLVFIHTKQNDFMTHLRNMIIINPQSELSIIEEHVSVQANQYMTNMVTDIYAGQNAHVNYYKLQDNANTATHIANIFVEQQKESCVKTFSFSKGARLAREDLSVWQKESGTESYLHGLYLLNEDQQHVDHHVHVDHLASHGTSSMLYKGILDKKSRAVFNGKVHVHPLTKHINAHQENHNLLLSNEAEVNTKPELEIYAEDVKCTHGATIGQLDNESLFYLRSRGIEKSEAHDLLVRAFAEDIYSKIGDEKIRDYIRNRMRHYDN